MSDELPPQSHDPSILGSSDRTEDFVRLLGQTQRYRFAYLMSLVRDRDAVDEILQDTNLVLWREFDRFEPGTNFVAWSCKIAFNQFRAWRTRQHRNRLRFSDEFLDAIEPNMREASTLLEERAEALEACVRTLSDRHQTLVDDRYTQGDTVDAIAARTSRSKDAVYRTLSRIRESLRNCVNQKLNAGGIR